MKTYTTTITSKGQITVPVTFRRRLGIVAGETFKISLQDNRVVAEKDDYWQQFDQLQNTVQTHLRRHKIAPLNSDELDKLRQESWSQKG